MSRIKRFAHSLASGYLLLVANAIYTLATVPLALHYLSREQFGLWALMTSIASYFSLVDLGMSSSIGRLLIDHKDNRTSDTYGSLIKTGWLVLTVQGITIFLVGFFIAPFLSRLLHIRQDMSTDFVLLLKWQCLVLALGFATRIFSHLLYAHQRIDIVNYAQMGMFVVNFALLWIFFERGDEVLSLVWAGLWGMGFSAMTTWLACWQLKLFPPANAWGQISSQHFKEVSSYGMDMFVATLGAQLVSASQPIIITRVLGLEAAGAWNVGTKMFNLCMSAIWRIPQMASPAFSEMIVKHEQPRLLDRYRAMHILILSLTGFAAVSLVMCNSLFVPLLSHHKFSWPQFNDVLLGFWMIILAVENHNSFALLTKKVGFMGYVLLAEGIVFVCVALPAVWWGGLPAVIATSIICRALFSGAYGIWRVSDFFRVPIREVALHWFIPLAKMLLFFLPLALGLWLLSQKVEGLLSRLVLRMLFSGTIGLYLFLRYGILDTLQSELLTHVPKQIKPFLRQIFSIHAQ